MKQVWPVRIAEQDYAEVLQWTTKTFGESQASTYAETMALAIEALKGSPVVLGADRFLPRVLDLHINYLSVKHL